MLNNLRNKKVVKVIILKNLSPVYKLEDGTYKDASGRHVPFVEKDVSTLIIGSYPVK